MDWSADSKGATAMNYTLFCDFVFDLAEVWCSAKSENEYTHFVQTIHEKLEHIAKQNNATFFITHTELLAAEKIVAQNRSKAKASPRVHLPTDSPPEAPVLVTITTPLLPPPNVVLEKESTTLEPTVLPPDPHLAHPETNMAFPKRQTPNTNCFKRKTPLEMSRAANQTDGLLANLSSTIKGMATGKPSPVKAKPIQVIENHVTSDSDEHKTKLSVISEYDISEAVKNSYSPVTLGSSPLIFEQEEDTLIFQPSAAAKENKDPLVNLTSNKSKVVHINDLQLPRKVNAAKQIAIRQARNSIKPKKTVGFIPIHSVKVVGGEDKNPNLIISHVHTKKPQVDVRQITISPFDEEEDHPILTAPVIQPKKHGIAKHYEDQRLVTKSKSPSPPPQQPQVFLSPVPRQASHPKIHIASNASPQGEVRPTQVMNALFPEPSKPVFKFDHVKANSVPPNISKKRVKKRSTAPVGRANPMNNISPHAMQKLASLSIDVNDGHNHGSSSPVDKRLVHNLPKLKFPKPSTSTKRQLHLAIRHSDAIYKISNSPNASPKRNRQQTKNPNVSINYSPTQAKKQSKHVIFGSILKRRTA